MSAANTLSFQSLQTNIGLDASRKTAVAILVDEINYFVSRAAVAEMTTNADSIMMGITLSNAVDDIEDLEDRRILDHIRFTRHDFGTAGNAILHKMPFKNQFFPPLIFAERSFYLAASSIGLASAAVIQARVLYRTVELDQGEFIELTEVFRLVG